VSDDALLRSLARVLRQSRRVEADLVAHIAEVDERRLYAREAAPSMHAYCIEVLHLSEPETALRIQVARASRKHPMLLEMLRDGRIHLSGIALLAPHLTARNCPGLLKRATHKTKRQIEEIVAALKPRPDVPAGMRRLPTPRSNGDGRSAVEDLPSVVAATVLRSGPDDLGPRKSLMGGTMDREHRPDDVERYNSESAGLGAHEHRPDDVLSHPEGLPCRPATLEPLAPARYQVKFTASQELHDKLERLQALMRSSVPDGDLGAIIDAAVTEKLERLEAKKLGKTKAPRKSLAESDTTPRSRHIPAAVRRAVWKRDGGRCIYVDAHGRRCNARERLEFHHDGKPFGRGGDHSLDNVKIACRMHNALMAELEYGRERMARYRRRPSGDRVSEAVAAYGAGSTSGPP
jgi:hypothetical protein